MTPLQELYEKIITLAKPESGDGRRLMLTIEALVSDALEREQTTPPPADWVKTTEQRPECGQPVYFINDGLVFMGFYIPNTEERRFLALNGNNYSEDKITYWMPRIVPKPPNQST